MPKQFKRKPLMIAYPQIDPVALQLGPLTIHWYGIMYLLGFGAAYWLGIQRARKNPKAWNANEIGDLVFYCAIGAVLGGRLGYIIFYKAGFYLSNPLEVLQVWKGGMAFHGGLIGVLLAIWLYARKTDRSFFQVGDFVAPMVPIGLLCGRVGNFINQELWGRQTDVPWAMVFPAGGNVARHPSMLYEAALEGVVLFCILWWYSVRPRAVGRVSGLFMIFYGLFRFLVEFYRVPDAHLGYLALDWVTMGQLLSLPMILFGAWLLTRTVATGHRHG
jgi:phosphatidylglycerol:prolipoprotein diacylglycerol transferase